MADTFNTSQFKKGIKIEIDGEPYLMVECNFVKPGKGNALYKTKLKNLLRGTILERTYKGGETVDAADVEETDGQFLYKAGDTFVFMDTKSFEQYELGAEAVGEDERFLKEDTLCHLVLHNGAVIAVTLPAHVIFRLVQCDPAVKGNTASAITKNATIETGTVIQVPGFLKEGELVKIDSRTGEYIERVKE